jgi:hypothetical protein
MEENLKPRRRWFRFSLRTVLVLVTLVCIYLTWAMNWKRQREEFLKSEAVLGFADTDYPAPIWIRIAGATGRESINLTTPDDLTLKEASRLFPEAYFAIVAEDGQTTIYKEFSHLNVFP